MPDETRTTAWDACATLGRWIRSKSAVGLGDTSRRQLKLGQWRLTPLGLPPSATWVRPSRRTWRQFLDRSPKRDADQRDADRQANTARVKVSLESTYQI
eukprot:scaffold2157_cov376-Prasinococcus_capsulatus_cf.AAC.17